MYPRGHGEGPAPLQLRAMVDVSRQIPPIAWGTWVKIRGRRPPVFASAMVSGPDGRIRLNWGVSGQCTACFERRATHTATSLPPARFLVLLLARWANIRVAFRRNLRGAKSRKDGTRDERRPAAARFSGTRETPTRDRNRESIMIGPVQWKIDDGGVP